MPSCVACGAELEPPVRTPHTVYVKSLYRIAGQDYCRHHIIRAAVAAGVITEIRAGAGPVVAMARSNPGVAPAANLTRPNQWVHEALPLPTGLTSITRTAIRRRSDSVSCSSSR